MSETTTVPPAPDPSGVGFQGPITHAGLDLSDREPAVTDQRLDAVREKLNKQWGYPRIGNFTLVTWIEPAREVETKTEGGVIVTVPVAEMAVCAVLADNPRKYASLATQPRLMTHATASLKDFREAEAEYQHFVGRPDPLLTILNLAVAEMTRVLKNLQEMI